MNIHRNRFVTKRRKNGVLEQRVLKLALQFTECPVFTMRKSKIKFPLFFTLTAVQNDQVVRPQQNSHQWCEFWLPAIHLIKLGHQRCVDRRHRARPRRPILSNSTNIALHFAHAICANDSRATACN